MTRLDGPTRLGLVSLLAYLAVAWAFRFDTVQGPRNASISYPFDTFSMYSDVFPAEASHVLARDAEGTVLRVEAFSRYVCATQIDLDLACTAADGTRIDYVDEGVTRWIESHPGATDDDERVEIVRRTWQLPSNGAPPPPTDCVIAVCRARR